VEREEIKRLKRRTIKLEEQLTEIKKDLIGIVRTLEKQENRFFELEEVDSLHAYPADRNIESIQVQLTRLKKYFPTLQLECAVSPRLPELAEGQILIPKFLKIASNYNEALEKVLEILAKERSDFLNGRDGELGENYLRLNNRTAMALEMLEKTKKGDYLLIPVQLGHRHLGKSSRRANVLFEPNEFGLGPFEIAIFLLTHPKWLTTENDLGIDCVGGEYGPYKHARFKNILCLYYLKGKLHFNDRWGGCPDEKFGAASAFLPKKVAINLRVDYVSTSFLKVF